MRQQTENWSSGRARGTAGGWRATCMGEQADSRTAPQDSRLRTQAPGARAQGNWQATCTGERADHGPTLWKWQTESVSRERAPESISRCRKASHGAPELRCAHWIKDETGSSGSVCGAAGGWRLEGHLHRGAGGLAVSTRETPDRDQELREPTRAAGDWQRAGLETQRTETRWPWK